MNLFGVTTILVEPLDTSSLFCPNLQSMNFYSINFETFMQMIRRWEWDTWLPKLHVSVIIGSIGNSNYQFLSALLNGSLKKKKATTQHLAFVSMASITSKLLLVLVCYVFLFPFASSSSSADFSGISLPSSSPKVSVGLYYESLCPYCSSFIVNHLTKLFEDDLISIVDLHLSPWGNTKLRPDNVTAVCQVLLGFLQFTKSMIPIRLN